jgi:serine/threonine protein kinase
MSLSTGERLGPYEIYGLIGKGGMGEVYRARDTRLERIVAIKVLPAELSVQEERLRRFEQEAQVLGALSHPNLLAIYDVGAQDGTHFLVSELLEGESLRQRLEEGALPLRKAMELGVQIAKGLAAAHEKGIVHRDIKPDNIFLARDGRAKILDFGLAKQSAAEVGENATITAVATQPGVVLGTAGYMSPEQVRGKPADARSDIFSFGAILYEMVAGQRAFHGDSPVETMNGILKQDPPAISGDVPPAIERVIRRCLEKSPEERFQSARDLSFALEALSAPSPSRETALASRPSLPRGTSLARDVAACCGGPRARSWRSFRRIQAAHTNCAFLSPTDFRTWIYRDRPLYTRRTKRGLRGFVEWQAFRYLHYRPRRLGIAQPWPAVGQYSGYRRQRTDGGFSGHAPHDELDDLRHAGRSLSDRRRAPAAARKRL